MKNLSLVAAAILVAAVAFAEEPTMPKHVMLTPAALQWGPAPPILPKGAKLAVLAGDPGKEGTFVIRLRFPAGFVVRPHWHPTDEHVTVIEGTMALGMGDAVDASNAKTLRTGSYALLPATMHHYAIAKTAAIVQVSGAGPFVLTYVDPADDPSKK